MRQRQELQRVVQHHHGGIRDLDIEYVALDEVDRRTLRLPPALVINDAAAALDHRGRVVHGHDAAARGSYTLAHGQRCGAERAAEVVAGGAGADVARRERPDRLE